LGSVTFDEDVGAAVDFAAFVAPFPAVDFAEGDEAEGDFAELDLSGTAAPAVTANRSITPVKNGFVMNSRLHASDASGRRMTKGRRHNG
jgi:hypothetical protein